MNNIEHYNYLDTVIFRIDFPQLDDYSKKFREIYELIRIDFPKLQIIRNTPFGNIGIIEGENLEVKSDLGVWQFTNKKNSKFVILDRSSLVFQIKKDYSNFIEFYSELKKIINALCSVFPEIVSTRTGLRYTNQIENIDNKDPLDWSEYISENLIGPIKFFSNKNSTSKYISQLESNDEDYQLNFKFGIPNKYYPNKIIWKEFVLDYDCYTYYSLKGEVEILKKVEELHKIIKDLFERSVKEEFKKKLR